MNILKTNTLKFFLLGLAVLSGSILFSNPSDNIPFNFTGSFSSRMSQDKIDRKAVPFEPTEIVIKYKKDTTFQSMSAKTVSLGFNLETVSARAGFAKAQLAKNETLEQAIARVSKDPMVEYAEPVYHYYATASQPNDPNFGKLWGLKNTGQTIASPVYTTSNPGTSGKDMDVLGAWDLTTDCSSTTIAVLDSGSNYNHEDLVGNLWDGSAGCFNHNGTAIVGGCPNHGWDYASSDNDPEDEEGHGTHVAGTIGAVGNNNLGSSGVCQSAKLMIVRVLGLGGGDNTTVSNGIYFAVRNGAKVINMSLGGPSYSSLIYDAIEYARVNDVLVVVAAGNENTDLRTGGAYPCKNSNDNIVCIAALDQSYGIANFSNFDTNPTTSSRVVDFGAPGTNIFSLYGTEVSYSENTTGYSGWTTANSGSAWTSATCTTSLFNMLTNPDCSLANALFDSGAPEPSTVSNNTNSMVFKDFTIPSGSTNVTLSHTIFSWGEPLSTTSCYDYLEVKYSSTSGNPTAGTTLPMWDSNKGGFRSLLCRSGTNIFVSESSDTKLLTNCIGGGTNCTVGYRFRSDSSGLYYGGLVSDFNLTAWAPSNTSYALINGTSMASPNAAGVAALIRAYNPSFTYQETIQKLIDGEVSESSLTSRTKYGKAINANDSIKHLKQVTGVTAVLQ